MTTYLENSSHARVERYPTFSCWWTYLTWPQTSPAFVEHEGVLSGGFSPRHKVKLSMKRWQFRLGRLIPNCVHRRLRRRASLEYQEFTLHSLHRPKHGGFGDPRIRILRGLRSCSASEKCLRGRGDEDDCQIGLTHAMSWAGHFLLWKRANFFPDKCSRACEVTATLRTLTRIESWGTHCRLSETASVLDTSYFSEITWQNKKYWALGMWRILLVFLGRWYFLWLRNHRGFHFSKMDEYILKNTWSTYLTWSL